MTTDKKSLSQKHVSKRSSNQPIGKNQFLSTPKTLSLISLSQKSPSDNFISNRYIIPVILFLSCFLLYGNTIKNDYAGDDPIFTTENVFVSQGFSAIKDIFDKDTDYGYHNADASLYRPFTLLSFMAEVSFFGFNPHLSHFFNVLLYAFTIILLYFLLLKIFKNYNLLIILASTLLFAFNPLHTEVIANIKGRDEILCFLFGTLSFYFIILSGEGKRTNYYYFSLAAFSIALFCQESAVTFVAIIPLLLYFFTGNRTKEIVIKSIPYLILTIAFLFIRFKVLQSIGMAKQPNVTENSLMAATNTADMMATNFVLLGKYIYMTIIPYPLCWDYSYNQIPVVSWGNIEPIVSLFIYFGMLILMFFLFPKKSIFSFLIALFFITIFVSSNLVIKIKCTFAERFLYIPSLSTCIALPVILSNIVKLGHANASVKRKLYFVLPIVFLLIMYTFIVIPRNAEWKNDFILYSSGIKTCPNSYRTHQAYGVICFDSANTAKDPEKKSRYYSLACKEIKMSIKIHPGNPVASNYLGVYYFNNMKYDTALYYFLMSYSSDTNYLMSLSNIGAAYQNEQKYKPAIHYYELLLKKMPGNTSALSNLAILYNTIGIQAVNNKELDSAKVCFTKSSAFDSNNINAIGNMGVVYQIKGNIELAKIFYKKAVSKDPKNEFFKQKLSILDGSMK